MDTPGAIFISYRRADSADIAGRIYDHLADRFGGERIFKDVDSIPPGVDFAEYIVASIGQSALELAIIGPRWLDAATGRKRRLDDPGDYVRIEIETALKAGVPVIPLLVTGAPTPPAQRLPESLRGLATRNAIQVRPDPDFRRDMERVIAAVEYWLAQPRLAPSPPAQPSSAEVAPAQPPPPVQPPDVAPALTPASDVAPRLAAPTAPPPAAKYGGKPPRPRRYQSLTVAIALVALVALVGVAFYTLSLGSAKGQPSQTGLPGVYHTTTAMASTEGAQSPTLAYRATVPGSCDTGVLKAGWTTLLENNHVKCVGDTAVVTGPATLDFTGNGGINANSMISFTIVDFNANPSSAGVTFHPTFGNDNDGRSSNPLPFWFKVTVGDRYAITYIADGAKPGSHTAGPSGFLRLPGGPHRFIFSYYPSRYTWEIIADDVTLTDFTYPASVQASVTLPQRIKSLDLIVDRGASVTLRYFSIAIAS